MAIQTREFTASEGEMSKHFAGPDQLEKDLDKLFINLDPSRQQEDGTPGGIGPENLRDESIGDKALVKFTPDQSIDTDNFNGTGKLGEILSVIAKIIKNISGKLNWWDLPTITIEALKSLVNANEADIENKLASHKVSQDHNNVYYTKEQVDTKTWGTSSILDLAITTAKLANLCVTTEKLANGAVTVDKINPSLLEHVILNVHRNTSVIDHPDGSITPEKLSFEVETPAGAQAKADAAAAAVQANLDSHKADYEYQIPTVNGTQIQLARRSNTKILKFKLDNDVSGGAITISLDGGSTSKPLMDIDGNTVTELSKGFVEVVEDSENFTLRPSGGVKITGQTEEIFRFGGTINKYDPVCVKFYPTKLTDPTTLPTDTGYGVAFDSTGTYLAVAHSSSPYITIYKRSGDTFTKLTNPAILPAGTGRGVAFDPTGTYLAVAHYNSPYITIYKRSGDTFTKLTDPATLPAGTGRGVAFDSTGTYLAVAHSSSPYITIYKRSGDTFTKLTNPATLPAGDGYGVAFDPTGTYLAVAHYNSPYITIYKRSGDTFTKLTNPATLPAGDGYGVAFDPTGTYLAVAHYNSPYITIYKRSGDTFTKLTNPAILPAGTGYGVAFDSTGTYLAVAHSSSPYITIYKRSGDTFTKLTNPAILPAGTGYDVAFDPTGIYLAVAHISSPYITIYWTLSCISSNLVSDLSNAIKAGYAKESGVAGEYKKIVVIFR